MEQVDLIFSILILILSVVIHEVAHGYAAEYQGDPTARLEGRLTLNPIAHLDPMGSVIIPLLLVIVNSPFMIGWAKPVPYNPYNLKYRKWGEALVAAAGPLSNLLIAFVFGLMIRFGHASFPAAFITIAELVVLINIMLAVFNLVPIPPLDGSKILFSALPYRWRNIQETLERYAIVAFFIFILFLWKLILPVVIWIFSLFTGLS